MVKIAMKDVVILHVGQSRLYGIAGFGPRFLFGMNSHFEDAPETETQEDVRKCIFSHKVSHYY